jgi:DNA topoisomerase II
MIPWYRGFKGDIEYSKSGTYKTLGKYEKIDDNTLWITELPIGEWIQDYKVKLEKMLVAGKLEEFKEHHTDVDVSFTLIFTDEQMSKLETEGIVKELKLFSWVHFSNMTLFDSNEMIKTYATPQEIIKDFCVVRKETYIARKKHLMKILQLDFDILDNKVRFILEVVENTLVIKKRKKSDLLKELKQKSENPFQLNV